MEDFLYEFRSIGEYAAAMKDKRTSNDDVRSSAVLKWLQGGFIPENRVYRLYRLTIGGKMNISTYLGYT